MTADSRQVVVTEESCSVCGTPQVNVHHQSFPEMSINGDSPERAAEDLALRLKANLDAVSDPLHQDPVRRAIADVQAYLARDVATPPQLSEVIDTAAAESAALDGPPRLLAKSETLEIRLLTLPKGRKIPTHIAAG